VNGIEYLAAAMLLRLCVALYKNPYCEYSTMQMFLPVTRQIQCVTSGCVTVQSDNNYKWIIPVNSRVHCTKEPAKIYLANSVE
jgi:hypothetical protein